MRSVTRTVLATGAMLMGLGAAGAQPPDGLRPAFFITEMPAAPFAAQARSPKAVIERLLSFDANADDRISRDELPERMQGLLERGDKNADAALDPVEIRDLVNAASSQGVRVAFRPQTFDGLAGVISDLKLPPATHARALAIVSAHKVPGNGKALARGLDGEMRAVLDDEEYENFVAAATRLSRTPRIIVK